MANRDSFSEAAQAEIVDSLEDARENHENAMMALGNGVGYELAATMAYSYGSVLHAFRGGNELSDHALSLIGDALMASVQNCLEADLSLAARDYEAAYAEVASLIW